MQHGRRAAHRELLETLAYALAELLKDEELVQERVGLRAARRLESFGNLEPSLALGAHEIVLQREPRAQAGEPLREARHRLDRGVVRVRGQSDPRVKHLVLGLLERRLERRERRLVRVDRLLQALGARRDVLTLVQGGQC